MRNPQSSVASNDPIRARGTALGRRFTAGVAACVLSLATGTSLRSAQMLLPGPEDGATPYLGI